MLGLRSLGVVVFGSGALGVRSGLDPWFGPGAVSSSWLPFDPAPVLGLYLLDVGSLLDVVGYPSCPAGARVRGSLVVPGFPAPGKEAKLDHHNTVSVC